MCRRNCAGDTVVRKTDKKLALGERTFLLGGQSDYRSDHRHR